MSRSSFRVIDGGGGARAGTFWEGRFGLGFLRIHRGSFSYSFFFVALGAAVVVAAASVVRPEVVGRRSLDGGHEGIIDVAPSPSMPACFMSRRLGGVGSKKRESEGPALMSKRQNHIFCDCFINSVQCSLRNERADAFFMGSSPFSAFECTLLFSGSAKE